MLEDHGRNEVAEKIGTAERVEDSEGRLELEGRDRDPWKLVYCRLDGSVEGRNNSGEHE